MLNETVDKNVLITNFKEYYAFKTFFISKFGEKQV